MGGSSADDILRQADLAMYMAKTTGKSKYVLADPAGQPAPSPQHA